MYKTCLSSGRGFVLLASIITGSSSVAGGFLAPPVSAGAPIPGQRNPGGASATANAPARVVLENYCVTCHSVRLHTGGLTLEGLDPDRVAQDPARWEKVVQKLRPVAMPPQGVRRPDRVAIERLTRTLEDGLDRAAAAHPEPGRSTAHRLNRSEYANAVRDLLGLEIDARTMLPADDSGYGFDNIADVLTVSPALFGRYMSAARKISQLAVGLPAPSELQTYRVPKYYRQDDRRGEEFSFGSRGGISLHQQFPNTGTYVVQVRLQTNPGGDVKGSNEPHRLEFRLDGERIGLLTIGAGAAVSSGAGSSQRATPPKLTDEDLHVRFFAPAGNHLLTIAFLKETWEPEGVLRPRLSGYGFDHDMLMPPAVATVEVEGPIDPVGPGDTASRRAIFQCMPEAPADEEACAGRILSRLARRAYRKPLAADDIETLKGFYNKGRAAGSFDAGIARAIERLLIDPQFLFRVERDPVGTAANTVYRITDLDLASRLSFYLWSSVPDDELLAVAERGELNRPGVLEQQVRRMLADRRSRALVDNFMGQWLQLRNLQFVAPDLHQFPDFDENLREGFQRELELFVESQWNEDRRVSELLTADYTFLNERLARHYGIPGIYGGRFRRVTLPDDSPRQGLLGKGGILTLTSYSTRTSPVLRGKWLLDNILGTPPPAPPANVPDLPDRGEDGRPRSVRERLEAHRANPMCATCHKQMDPLGFALENFDAVGQWRKSDGDSPIDASGMLPDGTSLNGPSDLRHALIGREDAFVGTVTQKLLIYALGRGLEYYDAPAVRRIIREAAPFGYRWSSLILGVVTSTPFQLRRSTS